ncbi:4076_t:CDS:1 [Acaulospora morrowiae]|uniref:4076_t:CDS:1 n=1 Tax=Acaulospora morrowiae TaxID=94023 RepID=A0A9N9C2K3_9GLOM|nr:4076_t:CDS:1 [Acaulospora morrowiae]
MNQRQSHQQRLENFIRIINDLIMSFVSNPQEMLNTLQLNREVIFRRVLQGRHLKGRNLFRAVIKREGSRVGEEDSFVINSATEHFWRILTPGQKTYYRDMAVEVNAIIQQRSSS